MHGVIWEPDFVENNSNTITIVTNRAGGVSLTNAEQDTIEFFLTRKLSNVNMDKGLPNRLEDTTQTRLDILVNFDSTPGNARRTQKELIDIQSNPSFII